MAEFRVRFVGDLGNLAAFNSAIRNSLSSNAAILERANSQVVSRAVGEQVRPSSSRGSGLFVRNATTEIDRLNNSFIQSGTVVRRYADGFTTEMRRVKDSVTGATIEKAFVKPTFSEAFHSDFRKAIGNVEAYERAISRLAPVEKQMIQLEGQAARRIADISNVQAQVGAYANLKPKQQTDAQRAALYRNINRLSPGSISSPNDLLVEPGSGVSIKDTVGRIQNDLHTQRVTIQKSLRAELTAIQNDPVVKAISQQAFYAATSPEGRLGRETVNVLNRYPNLRRDLEQKAGLGGGNPFTVGKSNTLNPAYAIAAQAKDFQVDSVFKDMERGLIRVSGSIRGADDIMSQFSYTIDKNGNTVNAWGRNLSGARGFLNQTGRDLVKVIEYSAAAAVVFGSLGVAMSSFAKINDLNVNLQRFAITARLSNEELNGMFEGLSQVAFATATPIGELVKAADDMALATRKANQSTEEWQSSILQLANAVGILTNISGLDTVRATELLVASMKQLNLETTDLVPLLSKITAAAGGQSASITDIASALAVLAEAAESARIPLEGQIAAVQVISQVTGKSADQTANAFKNLFGAIGSEASVKKLEEFGIAVRDLQTGELRPFLEIYKDISDAVQSGIIPEGRLNEVLRAISGGRTGRQADAAALLSNINRVFEVQGIAASSSNEALIANAKILDTNQAKITRFQNAFDEAIFKQFNEVVADLTSALVDLGTILAGVFTGVPSQVITITVEILALVSAIKLLSKVGALINLGGFFKGLRGNLLGKPGPINGLVEAAPELAAQGNFSSVLFDRLSLKQQEQYLEQKVLSGTLRKASTPLADRGVTGYIPPNTRVSRYIEQPKLTYAQRLAGQVGGYYNYPGGYQELNQPGPKTATGPRQTPLLPYYYGAIPPPPTGGNIPTNLPLINLNQRLADSGIPVRMDSETKSVVGKFLGVFSKENASKVLGSRQGKFAAGAAIGGAAAAAAGGTNLGGLAQLAGSALLFTPAAPVGAGLLIGGAIIDHFNQQAEEAKKKADDLQNTLYNLTLQWKQDNAAVNAAQTSYSKIQEGIAANAGDTEKLVGLQKQLAEATIDVALAQATQSNSTKEIIKTVSELAELSGDPRLRDFSNLIGTQLNSGQLSELVGIISKDILKQSGQNVFLADKTNFDPSTLRYGAPSNQGITVARPNPVDAFKEFSASEFAQNDDAFRRYIIQRGFDQTIFGPTGEAKFNEGDFPFQNPAAIEAFRGQAARFADKLSVPDQEQFYNRVVKPFEEAVAKFGLASTVVNQAITNAEANIQARQLVGVLSGEAGINASTDVSAARTLQNLLSSPTANIGSGYDRETRIRTYGVDREAANNTISQLLSNSEAGTFNAPLFKTAADQALQTLGVLHLLPEGVERTTAEAKILREQFGLTDEQIVLALGDLGNMKTTAQEMIEELQDGTNKWAQSMQSEVGGNLLQLQARLQGGEFYGKDGKFTKEGRTEYNFLKAQYEAEAAAIRDVQAAALDLEKTLGEDASSGAQNLLDKLNELNINGFQGVEANVDSLNGAFFNWITTLNLTGKQIGDAVKLWVRAMQLAVAAAKIAGTAIRYNLYVGTSGIQYTGIPYGATTKNPSLNLEQGYNAELQRILGQLGGLGGKGSGTYTPGTTSGSSKTGPSATTDTLYLSEEQQKLADPVALVKQAYQDALKLQSQIPGETKKNRLNTVVVFDELQKIFSARGVSEELLRRALDNLTEQMEVANQKADVVRRIRVGSGDFSAIANVPVNSSTGVSVGGSNQINITFNLNGITSLTPANIELLKNAIGAEIARRL